MTSSESHAPIALRVPARSAPDPAPKGDLPPFPAGWFVVGWTHELGRSAVLTRRFMGRDLVLFRTASGEVHAVDAHCPHLGAHLGHGGTVHGETLRCPFHGFRFEGRGRCVSVPYDCRPPPGARLRPWPLRERDGVILVYHHPHGLAPDWEVPPLDADGWSPLVHRRLTLRGHPQETTENCVDVGHFAVVHGYADVAPLAPLEARGPRLDVGYRMRRPFFPRAGGGPAIDAAFTIQVHGLGYSRVEVALPRLGLSMRQLVFATPTDAGALDLHLAVSVDARAPTPIGRALPRALAGLVSRGVLAMFVEDVSRDLDIWAHKRHLEKPALAAGDGPIPAYRRWARQFYPR